MPKRTSARRRRKLLTRTLGLALIASAAIGPAAALADVRPFGRLHCVPDRGVRVCRGTVATRIPSFDGVPLDVTVTLPRRGDTGLPLIVLLHGYGNSKDAPESGFQTAAPAARRGYAVLAYSARGFGDSCGTLASRLADRSACAKGWLHLADARYEGHDTQYLAGLLADQGLIAPRRIGIIGISYGAGQTMLLATLRDRIMEPDGRLVPWRSPRRKLPMRIAAAAPIAPWSDLAYALLPNGRTLDYTVTGRADDTTPFGVEKQSFVSGLYPLGLATGFYAPPGIDPRADVTTWVARISLGEPYDGDPEVRYIADQVTRFHSAYYLHTGRAPAPLLIANGWTDDLFPAEEAVRYANRVQTEHPGTPMRLLLFDFGHPRGSNKDADVALLKREIGVWFDHYVKGAGVQAPFRGVEALTQTCPHAARSGGPFRAGSYPALHPGEVRQTFGSAQLVVSGGGDPSTAAAIDPVKAGANPCVTTPAKDDPGTASFRLRPAPAGGYTLLGAPTVIADLAPSGAQPQLAARLWDVSPGGGDQILVGRTLYRPRPAGRQVFQLHANGWRFAPGHVPRLELLGQDSPYGRASNGAFTVRVSALELRLPVRDRPGSSPVVREPGALFLPPGARLAPGTVSLRLRLRYRRAAREERARSGCSWRSVSGRVVGRGLANVRRVDFTLDSRPVGRDDRRPFLVSVRASQRRRAVARLSARGLLSDGRRVEVTRRLAACRARTAHGHGGRRMVRFTG